MVTRFHRRRRRPCRRRRSSRGRDRRRAPAQAFRKLHDIGAVFPFRFELFSMIDDYLKVLATKEVDFAAGLSRRAAARPKACAARSPRIRCRSAACHCDPLCENFLDTGERMWIVDWEYSGMNDPMWDLGDLSVEGRLRRRVRSEEMMRRLFRRRAEAQPSVGRIVIYKAMCDLLWTLWGLIQLANKNPVDDFWAYADEPLRTLQAPHAGLLLRRPHRRGPQRLTLPGAAIFRAPRDRRSRWHWSGDAAGLRE